MKTTKAILPALLLVTMALTLPTAQADTGVVDAKIAYTDGEEDRICNEHAVYASDCNYCPESSSSYEYCKNNPQDQVHCSHMVRGVCVADTGNLVKTTK